ncbi:BGTF surface domain-containing protein [Halorarum halobium]|uniref:BGTF surface domain-containing protein n=1 Tax=Halorarum halobium TaxID=3075121 RepID=UPI0028AFDD83|nr:BGTF surface domain-containing protein [Halobaculum sp. XH14]
MTETNNKIRALFLTALMVFSVFAMTVAFGGSAAAAVGNQSDLTRDAEMNTGSTYWAGQQVLIDTGDDNASESWQVRSVDTDAPNNIGGLEEEFTLDENGTAVIDTSDLDGTYVVVNSTGDPITFTDGDADGHETDANDASFEVAPMSLTTEFADDEAGNAGPSNSTELSISSNRGSYNVTISSEDLDADELHEIFNDSAAASMTVDTGTDGDDDAVQLSNIDDGDYTANFTDIDAGNYTFTVDATDTTASDTANITVNDVSGGATSFETSTIEEEQGDIATFNVSISGAADTASVTFGDYSSIGYQLNFTAEDGSGDGQVTVAINTYAAGNPDSTIDEVVYATSEDDSVTNRDEAGTGELGSVLATGNYRLGTAANANQYVSAMDDPDDVGTLVIRERSTNSATIWTAPSTDLDTDDDEDDAVGIDDLEARMEGGSLTESDEIALGDYVVVQVSATGLNGTAQLSAANFTGDEEFGGDLTVEQTGNIGNFQPKALNVSASQGSISLFTDQDSDSYYIAFQTDEVQWNRTVNNESVTPSDGETYEATYTVEDDFLLGSTDSDDHQSVNTTFDTASRTVSIDDDPVNVTVGTNQTVSGTSSLAPGSEIQVRAESDDGVQPAFFKSATAVVQPDGTWSAELDFSEQSTGDTFTVEADASNVDTVTADGNVVETLDTDTTAPPTTEPPTEPPTTEPPTEPPTTEPPTEDPGTEPPTEPPTTTTTPGFTAVLALIALIGAAFLATRRD